MISGAVGVGLVLAGMAAGAQGASSQGLSFSHKDWELACDNTRTCRAAGYSDDAQTHRVSVQLERRAGAHTAVEVNLMLGQEDDAYEALPSTIPLDLVINGKRAGSVSVERNTLVATLAAAETKALLAALAGTSTIEWVHGDIRWRLSDKGSSAVLLKMDEFQGRIGTPGALVRTGTRDEKNVLPPLPAPEVVRGRLAAARPGDATFDVTHAAALREMLRSATTEEDCSLFFESGEGEPDIDVWRLTDTKLLVATPCWRGAYNAGNGYWVINQVAPFDPVFVTTEGSEYGSGEINGDYKGRGLGDCWSSKTWTWDGSTFVLTRATSTGMCRMIAPGGAWELPTVITNVTGKP
ncbi:DUF1176 domain-containing protein [Tahibacter amnicola]|uniref:DUF1176 domain-containing protein n=1 Tax=Tahibacter amnicola TaxID=2976241 RepID=A0ABY6BKM5_9GAMM|nr:DUF1176 domain-containing protein [Tahibacter amnicola]UXI70171.1 DUF1176 domain-containing protein [Tahibacter amnicola]